MNKKLLSIAIAAVAAAPLSAHAELKLSGDIQFEIGNASIGNADSITLTSDGGGALLNGGPNKIKLDFDEKLGAGLTAFGRFDRAFNTSNANDGGLSARESFVGLKGSMAHIRLGRIQGIYKTTGILDPFYSTTGQARNTGGGMTGGNFGHSGFVDNVMELGFKTGGFSAAVQGIFDEKDKEKSSVLGGLEYNANSWGAFIAGAYHDFKIDSVTSDDKSRGNAKIGGWYKTGGLKLGLQYEMAEDGTLQQKIGTAMQPGQSGEGDYVFGTASYGMGNITLAGWVAGYMSDDDNEDAVSFSLGALYNFSKRTFVYAAYHDTNSDNDSRDWDGFAAGVRHSF